MLHDDLKKLKRYPFHMPGHKRNPALGIEGSEIDITEISGFDDLHKPTGAILDLERELAELYCCSRSHLLVNGSTVGILAAVFAVAKRGDKVLISRNCHKSVYNACLLRELKTVYIEPEFDGLNGYYTRINQSAIDRAVAENPDASAVIVTSPTYEGNVSYITAEIPVIIDAAHGAHLPFCGFCPYPKGDLVISSLHKTLPALTQTAVINIYNEYYSEKVKEYLDIFETSSPSYVLMNSVSKCVRYIKNGKKDFAEYKKNLEEFYKTPLKNLEFTINDDIGKIVVSTARCGITGVELANILRDEFLTECEMASLNYVLLMTSPADTEIAFNRLSSALEIIDGRLSRKAPRLIKKPDIPEKICESFEVENTAAVPLNNAEGKICGEFVYAYPPGVPIIVPGEIITTDIIKTLTKAEADGINILSAGNLLPRFILTKSV